MIITCPCGQANRAPSLPKSKMRCGKCRREFTPAELSKGVLEAPPTRTLGNFVDEPTHECKDESCGWEGEEDELEEDRCPDCGSRVRKLKREEDEE